MIDLRMAKRRPLTLPSSSERIWFSTRGFVPTADHQPNGGHLNCYLPERARGFAPLDCGIRGNVCWLYAGQRIYRSSNGSFHGARSCWKLDRGKYFCGLAQLWPYSGESGGKKTIAAIYPGYLRDNFIPCIFGVPVAGRRLWRATVLKGFAGIGLWHRISEYKRVATKSNRPQAFLRRARRSMLLARAPIRVHRRRFLGT
jgi:hypothetical protein